MKIRCLYDKLVPIEDLKLNPNNRNVHPPEQIERLAEILDYQGWRYCVKVSNQSGVVTAGHGRIEAALLKGWDTVPVNFQDYDSPEQEYADTIADNAIASWAELNLSGIQMDVKGLSIDFKVEMLGMKDLILEPADKFLEDQDEERNEESQEDLPEDIIPDHIEPRVKEGERYKVGAHQVFNGDCLKRLKELKADSIDSMVTDPPAGISFMGKDWDEDKGGSKEWIAWMKEVMQECLRVMKPGAHGLVWAIPRTSHWTASALEDAGFEIRDVVTHLFGSGFPKSMNISIAIDKQAGAAITPEAKQWQGWGTALKPASEHWILVRKPLSEKTVAANVLKYGTGGLNIDASRIRTSNGPDGKGPEPQGRFPANLVLSHNDDCVSVGSKKVKNTSGSVSNNHPSDSAIFGTTNRPAFSAYKDVDGTETVDAYECTEGCAVAELDAQSGERPVSGSAKLGKLSSGGHKQGFIANGIASTRLMPNDTGGASRFFYCAKASKSERNAGCEGLEERQSPTSMCSGSVQKSGEGNRLDGKPLAKHSNHHPTVKPVKLMSYLIKLVTPPEGKVLDCFAGSGSTLVACHMNQFSAVLIEQSPEYCDIILARAEHFTEKSAVLI